MINSRLLFTTFGLSALLCSICLGVDLDIRVVEATEGRSAIIADPGEAIAYEIRGRLTDLDNEGLAGFAFDLAYEGGPLAVPVNPGDEEKSWQRFYDEAFDKFINGEYAGEYEQKVIDEFEGYLPVNPPWQE